MDTLQSHNSSYMGANIGKSVAIKGELSGSEDLFLDGEVEGSIDLGGHRLTIGQNGRVHAAVSAKEVVIQGRVEGNVHASDRIELRATATVNGDLQALRIAVEDGAHLQGKIETIQDSAPEAKAPATDASVKSAPGPVMATALPAGAPVPELKR